MEEEQYCPSTQKRQGPPDVRLRFPIDKDETPSDDGSFSDMAPYKTIKPPSRPEVASKSGEFGVKIVAF
jgi:hypothetical protein